MADVSNKPEVIKRNLKVTFNSFTMFATPRTRKDRQQLRLTFGCDNGYPNVNVETDEDTEAVLENGFNRLSSRLNGPNFGAFLNLIDQATKEEPGWKRGIECYHTYKDGVQHEKPVKVNDLVVGVDNQHLVYLTILQAGRTSAKFVFGPTDWHNFIDSDGNPLSQREQNTICAKAAVESLRIAMNTAISINVVDEQTVKAGLPSPSVKPAGEGGNFTRNFNNAPAAGGGNAEGQQGGYQKKPWQGNNNQQGGYQKKPWQGNNGGGQGGGYQKKPWQGGGGQQGGGGGNNYNRNFNGGGGGGYQKKPWDGNNNQGGNQGNQHAPANPAKDTADEEFEF